MMERTERCIDIPELVFRYAKLSPDTILEIQGISPSRPYDHTEIIVHGAVVHRYIQPPRPRKPGVSDA